MSELADPPPETGRRHINVVTATEHPLVTSLAETLGGLGFSVTTGPSVPTSDDPCVIVLSDELVELLGGPESAAEALGGLGVNVLPVTPTSQAYSAVMGDRSQLPLESFGVERAARRIALVATVGPDAVSDWNSAYARAVRWQSEKEPIAALLTGQQIEETARLLTQPVAELPGVDASPVRRLVEASRERARRRRRRALVAVTVALTLVAGSGVAALVARHQAQIATAEADTAAAVSEADRLAGLAEQLNGSDPDLPWILAHEALSLAETPTTVAAAHLVVDNGTPHRTYAMRAPVTSLVALPDNRVAAGFAFGAGYLVMDTTDGSIVFDHPPDSTLSKGQTTTVLANPARSEVFAVAAGADKGWLLDLAGEPEERTLSFPAPLGAWTWLDDNSLVMDVGGELLVAEAQPATTHPLGGTGPATAAGILDLVTDPEGQWLAVATEGSVTVWGLAQASAAWQLIGSEPLLTIETGTNPHRLTVRQESAQSPEVLAFLHDSSSHLALVEVDQVLAGQVTADEATTDLGEALTGFAFAPGGALYCAKSTGGVFLLAARSDYLSARAAAHSGPVTGLVARDDGTWVTGGGDYAIRVWQAPVLSAVVAETYQVDEQLRAASDDDYAESSRATLTAVPDSGEVIAAVPAGNSILTLDRTTLEIHRELRGSYFVMTRMKVARDTPNRIAQTRSGGPLYLVDLNEGTAILTKNDMGVLWYNSSLFTLNPEGTVIALAIRGMMGTVTETGVAIGLDLAKDEIPVYVGLDDSGIAVSVTTSGLVTWMGGHTRQLFDEVTQVTAATRGQGSDFLTLDWEGTIRRHPAVGDPVVVGTMASSLGGYALTLSPSGRYIAVIGSHGTEVWDTATQRTALRLDPLSSDYWPVDDVLFDDDEAGLLTVRSNGWVEHHELLDVRDTLTTLQDAVPRGMSDAELRASGIGG